MPSVCAAIVCSAILIAPLSGHAAHQSPPAPTAELLALEQLLFSGMHEKNETTLDRLLAAGFVLRATPDVSRDAWMTDALSLCWGEDSDITDFRSEVVDAVAIVSFLLTSYQDPDTCEPATLTALVTDVWIRRDAGWQLAVRHSGPAGDGTIRQQFARAPDAPSNFEAQAELSFVATGGNTSIETLGLGAETVHRGRSTTTTGKVAFVRSEANAEEDARSLELLVRHGVRLSERIEAFARGSYRRDLFAGVEHRGTLDAGVSYGLSGLPHAFTLDIGLGATSEARLRAKDERFLSTTAGVSYTWTPSTTTEVGAETSAILDLSDFENWRATSDVSLLVELSRLLSARVSYSQEYLNRPVPGFQASDTTVSAALVLHYRGTP